jgi:hypothetical protein
MYEGDKLKEYIDNSILKIVNKDFRIRLSKELAKKYDAGVYDNAIKNFKRYIKQIKDLHITYPANAKPIFYIYIVPDDNFVELLQFPYKNRKSGGRPVQSYDIDGFNSAYGVSQNIFENFPKQPNIMREVNHLHELAHLVHGMFFQIHKFMSEGFAEAFVLYTMEYENEFKEHRDSIKKLKPDQIFTIRDLLKMEKDHTFSGRMLIPNYSCSFDFSYISSYLAIRTCLEKISPKFNMNRIEATQKFLEIIKFSSCTNEWLVFDIADTLGLSRDELLNQKSLQIETLKNL